MGTPGKFQLSSITTVTWWSFRMFMGRLSLTVLVLMVSTSLVSGGFRCTLGQWACSASCVTLGQTSGICDGEGECNCSERSISLSNLRDLLPSRCNLGESFCEGTCNAIGRTGGKCVEKDGVQDCQCDETFLTGSQFALCGAESTCRLDCQRRGLASGECDGWNCVCSTNVAPTVGPSE